MSWFKTFISKTVELAKSYDELETSLCEKAERKVLEVTKSKHQTLDQALEANVKAGIARVKTVPVKETVNTLVDTAKSTVNKCAPEKTKGTIKRTIKELIKKTNIKTIVKTVVEKTKVKLAYLKMWITLLVGSLIFRVLVTLNIIKINMALIERS